MNGNVETVNGALLNDEAEKIALKMMLLGKESVGKTSFRNCLAGGALPTDHIPTYLDIQFFHMRTNNSVDLVKLADSAGQEEFHQIIEAMMALNDGFMLIYSIDDMASFKIIEEYLFPKLLQIKQQQQQFLAVLIGNKQDKEAERAVSFEQGMTLAEKLGIPFKEISLKNNPNQSTQIFIQLVLSMKAKQYKFQETSANTTTIFGSNRSTIQMNNKSQISSTTNKSQILQQPQQSPQKSVNTINNQEQKTDKANSTTQGSVMSGRSKENSISSSAQETPVRQPGRKQSVSSENNKCWCNIF